VLGRDARARSYIAGFQAQLASLKTQFAPIVNRTPRVTIIFMPNPNVTFLLGSESGFVPMLRQLGFQYTVPANANVPGNAGGSVALEALPSLQTDLVIALRLKTGAGDAPKLPAEALLERGGAKLIRYVLDPLESQSGPITDLLRARGLLSLMR
jgi:ABC-type Fe3+-hydroxamate transport system substrate-binding protein